MLKDQYVTIELQIGKKSYECEVRFNYTPAVAATKFEPSESEEFEVFKVLVIEDSYHGCKILNDDLIDLLNDEIIEKIQEQKQISEVE